MSRGTRLRRSVRLLLTVVPVLALLVAGLQAPAAAATATISGRVTLTAGGPAPAGTKVLVRPAGGGTALATTTTDASNGAYSLSVTAGTVDVVVNAPEGSGFGQTIVSNIDASANRTVDVQLAPSDAVTLSGVVRDGQGSTLSQVRLELGTQVVTTDSQGRYSATIAPGVYDMNLIRNSDGKYSNFNMTAPVTITTARTLDLTVPTHRVDYRVVGPSGNPVANAKITLPYYYSSYQSYTLAPGITTTYNYIVGGLTGTTNNDGILETRVLATNRTVAGSATAPAGSTLADTPFTVPVITGDSRIDVTMREPVTVSGVVRDGQGSPLSQVRLELGTQVVTTDSQGRYSATIAPGVYDMNLIRNSDGKYSNFNMTAPVTITTARTLDLTVPTHRVDYRVVGPSGNPVANAKITLPYYYSSYQSYTLAPGITTTYNYIVGGLTGTTNNDGILETRVLATNRTVAGSATAPAGSTLADTPFTVPVITGDSRIDVTMREPVTVSGVVRDGQGSPLSQVRLELGTQVVTTDSQGRYSATIAPGVYDMNLIRNSDGKYSNFNMTAPVTITTARTLDLTVPTHRVDYRVVGPSGNPVANAKITLPYYYSSYQSYTLAPGITTTYNYIVGGLTGTTNNDGILETRVLATNRTVAGSATAPAATTLPDTPFTVPTIDGDRTLVISFSKSTVDQTPPTVTCGSLPTDWRTTNASVTCTATDAGVGLRNASDASFEIATTIAEGQESGNATAGPRQVCDLADNCTDAVASGAKVDRKAPVVSFDRADGVSLAKDAVATLGYTCTDGGSGLATCTGSQPSGQALDTSTTGDHDVTVTAKDKVGNERTVTFHYTVTAGTTPPPGPGGKAKLSLSNAVSPLEALPGDTVTYTLTATNGAGAGDATGTVVTDVLPDGVTFADASEGCTNDKGTVRCELGTIAAGASTSATIHATVDPIPMRADPNTAHQILEQKAETDLRVERGETKTATASCPTGYLATDGGIRLDAVDQGGDVAKTGVPASGPTADGSGWTATLRNDNPGAALAKVTVACLARTTVTGEHQHDLVTTAAAAPAQPLVAGTNTVTVACPAGQTPFAPSYALSGGGVVTTSRETGSGWSFVVDSPAAGTGDFGVACLGARTTTAAGHFHALGIDHRAQSISVPAGQTIETQLTCADQAKGIVASRRLDPGLVDRGTDPRAKIRSFRFTNPTDHTLSADLGLTCVDIRTSGEPVAQRITSTATVATSAIDATTADDTASSTFTAYGDGWAILPTTTATVGGSARSASIGLDVRCASDCVVSARLVALGKVRGTSLRAGSILASGRTSLAAGGGRLTVRATGTAASALTSRKVVRAKVVITTSDGATTTKTITLRR